MTQQIGNSQLVDTWAAEGPIVEPDITKVDEGWQLGEQPPHEWMNYLQNLFGRQVNYLIQNGVAEWNATDEQPAGVFKRHNGKVWRAVNTTTNSEPSDANANWSALASEEYVDDAIDALSADVGQNIAVFDTAGTSSWSVPSVLQSGLRKAHVTVVGGGGAGGAGTSTTTVGRPGASAGWTMGFVDLSGVASVPVTVGSGGLRVTNESGGSGGTSSFGSYLSATGGQGGSFGSGDGAAIAGVGSGGDLNFQGNNGSAQNSDGAAVQPGRPGPFGGAGAGQRAGAIISAVSATAPGASGGGGYSGSNAGNGYRGIVIVRW